MCTFCKIVDGKIPCFKIYETSNIIAFLDISQVTKGHTLVIPKKHYPDLLSLDDEIASELFRAVIETTKILKSKLNVNDFNLLNNNGPLAGQEVLHYHIHILPRYPQDGCTFSKPHKDVDFEQLRSLHAVITK